MIIIKFQFIFMGRIIWIYLNSMHKIVKFESSSFGGSYELAFIKMSIKKAITKKLQSLILNS